MGKLVEKIFIGGCIFFKNSSNMPVSMTNHFVKKNLKLVMKGLRYEKVRFSLLF